MKLDEMLKKLHDIYPDKSRFMIKRRTSNDVLFVNFYEEPFLKIKNNDFSSGSYDLTFRDIIANDWLVYDKKQGKFVEKLAIRKED